MKEAVQVHFTLGPVQGFVAQARRTRDLWAGSFLLSYLAGQAMCAVLDRGGTIRFPQVHDDEGRPIDPLLEAIARTRTAGPIAAGPHVGSLPNRFVAELPRNVPPEDLAGAVRAAWQQIAAAVWERFVAPVAHWGKETEAIWNRQVQGFWEITWVAAPGQTFRHELLDQRKNWRTHVPTDEPGDKCTIMGNLQELSGYLRSKQRAEQDAFWDQLRTQGRLSVLDLEPDERLCSIALIKRLFPLVAKTAIGWPVPTGYPSTVYLAAAPWVARICQEQPTRAAEYGTAVRQNLPHAVTESRTRLQVVEAGLEASGAGTGAEDGLWTFAHLDGNLYHTHALANPRHWEPGTERVRQELAAMLAALTERVGSPPIYYALLLMDGDSMGALLRAHDPAAISAGLRRFTRLVPEVIAEHSGQVVYAGGDDVLALLPLPFALGAAARLRQAYTSCMAASLSRAATPPTISGAIVYAHARAPLTQVLAWAHRLLDDEAKDRTQRDALAIGVWQSGGPTLTWAGPWNRLLEGQPPGRTLLEELVEFFQGAGESGHRFSSRFFHKIREHFELLTTPDGQDLLPGLDPIRVLTAEYLRSRDAAGGEPDVAEVETQIEKLLRIARSYRRPHKGADHRPTGPLRADGPLLIRFLATKGVE